MSKNDISINTDSILDSAQNTKNLVNRFSNLGNDAINTFDKMGSVYGDNIKDLSKKVNSILGQADRAATNRANFVQAMDSKDSELANKALSEIEVPLDFTANNTLDTNKFNVTYIQKVDGTSVNEGHQTKKANEIDDSTIAAAESLTNISGDQTKSRTYDDTTIIGKSILGNISGDQTKAQTYDDSTSVGNTKLKSVGTSQDLNSKTYDESSSVNRSNLQNISGNQSSAQTYDDSTVIGKSILGSVNSNANAKSSSFDDDAIAAAVENKKALDENVMINSHVQDSSKKEE